MSGRALLVDAEVARAASAAKDQFLAGLSHELRTPLTPVVAAISGLEPRLARGELGLNEMRDFVAMLRRNLDYEVRLIDDLLDASRLTFGKLALDREDVDLHEVVADAVSLVAAEAARKPAWSCGSQLRRQKLHVEGDASRLRQVFWNLLRNAVKFTPAGGSVTVRSRSAAGLVAVEVRDTRHRHRPGRALPRVRALRPERGRQPGRRPRARAHHRPRHRRRARRAGPGRERRPRTRARVSSSSSPRSAKGPVRPRPRPGRARDATARAGRMDGPAHPAGRRPRGDRRRPGRAAPRRRATRSRWPTRCARALAAGQEGMDLLITDIGLPDGSGHELIAAPAAGGSRCRPSP